MKNKKGFFIWIIVIILVLAILASVLGLVFLDKFVEAIGSAKIAFIIVIALAIIFRKFVEAVLITVWGWVRAIVKI